jgi:hypothetical protein
MHGETVKYEYVVFFCFVYGYFAKPSSSNTTIIATEQKCYISYFSSIAYLFPQTCKAAVPNYTIFIESTQIHRGLCVRLVRSEPSYLHAA